MNRYCSCTFNFYHRFHFSISKRCFLFSRCQRYLSRGPRPVCETDTVWQWLTVFLMKGLHPRSWPETILSVNSTLLYHTSHPFPDRFHIRRTQVFCASERFYFFLSVAQRTHLQYRVGYLCSNIFWICQYSNYVTSVIKSFTTGCCASLEL